MKPDNVVLQKSYEFALSIIHLYIQLQKQHEYVLSRQLLRCGTSIGANVEEAQAAQSRADFVSKMSIASKEARESNYWMRLLRDSELTTVDVSVQLAQSAELVKIIAAIVKSTRDNT